MRAPVGIRVVLLMLLYAAGPGAVAGGAVAQQDVREVARDVISDGAYQKKIRGWRDPGRGSGDGRGEPGLGGSRRDRPRGQGVPDRPTRDRRRASPASGGSFMRVFFLLAFALVAAWAVLGIISALRERRRHTEREGNGEGAPEPTEGIVKRIDPFHDLAASGRLAEAVHMMLLAVIEHHRTAVGKSVSPSATARELLRRLPRSDEERAGLKRLVAAVEVSLFGGRAVSEPAYRACLDAYRGLIR